MPCEAIKPSVEGFAEKYGDKLKFAKLNTTGAKRLAMSQKVMSLPSLIVYEGGEKVESILKDGANETDIEAMINRHI